MKTTKVKILAVLLVTALAAAGVLAAVAMAWPQSQPRSLQQPQQRQRPQGGRRRHAAGGATGRRLFAGHAVLPGVRRVRRARCSGPRAGRP